MSRRLPILLILQLLAGCASLHTRPAPDQMSFEESKIFYPHRFPAGDWRPDDRLFSDASFTSGDGTPLHGWLAESDRPTAVVLYCHGNAGNIADRRWVLELFRNQLHCSVLVFDYRGFGKSEGVPSEEGVLQDARAARRWLADRARVAERDVVLVGNSLGGGVAVDLAARDGARALVLENTFTSLPDVAASHIKAVPFRWIMQSRLDSLSRIKTYHGPLLQTHGDADAVVPFRLGRTLFEAANEPKQFVVAKNRGHNNPPTLEYRKALERFLESLPPRS